MSLKKEMVLAIFLGALLGAVVALTITQVPQKLLKQISQTPKVSPFPEQSPPPSSKETLSLEILLPEDQALTTEESITVSGKAHPGATVVISSPFDEEVIIASDDGTFSGQVSLEEGANEILLVSLANEEEAEKTIVVNYTKEEI